MISHALLCISHHLSVRVQIRMQDAVQAAAAAEERRIRADNYRATLLANFQLAEARAARDAAERHSELMRSEAELSATLADPYLGEDPAMAASSLSAYRQFCYCPLLLPFAAALCCCPCCCPLLLPLSTGRSSNFVRTLRRMGFNAYLSFAILWLSCACALWCLLCAVGNSLTL